MPAHRGLGRAGRQQAGTDGTMVLRYPLPWVVAELSSLRGSGAVRQDSDSRLIASDAQARDLNISAASRPNGWAASAQAAGFVTGRGTRIALAVLN